MSSKWLGLGCTCSMRTMTVHETIELFLAPTRCHVSGLTLTSTILRTLRLRHGGFSLLGAIMSSLTNLGVTTPSICRDSFGGRTKVTILHDRGTHSVRGFRLQSLVLSTPTTFLPGFRAGVSCV